MFSDNNNLIFAISGGIREWWCSNIHDMASTWCEWRYCGQGNEKINLWYMEKVKRRSTWL